MIDNYLQYSYEYQKINKDLILVPKNLFLLFPKVSIMSLKKNKKENPVHDVIKDHIICSSHVLVSFNLTVPLSFFFLSYMILTLSEDYSQLFCRISSIRTCLMFPHN